MEMVETDEAAAYSSRGAARIIPQAQAICMQTKDYERAYETFVAKTKPILRGH